VNELHFPLLGRNLRPSERVSHRPHQRTAERQLRILLLILMCLVLPPAASAQLKVITSGGFQGAYEQVLPEFEQTTGITVSTGSGASQGTGPDTIGAQLSRGVSADVLIMSREGLDVLIAQGRILSGSDVDIAKTFTGLAVRAGAPKPDISSLESFSRTLLSARSIAVPGSTTGLDLINRVFPQLHVDPKVVKVTARGVESAAMVARGDAELAIQPVSELIHAAGVDLVGTIPEAVQFTAVLSAAIVRGSTNLERARQLLAYLTSPKVVAAIQYHGMQPLQSGTSAVAP
jgi:molybdate transport system substrate-binding protein